MDETHELWTYQILSDRTNRDPFGDNNRTSYIRNNLFVGIDEVVQHIVAETNKLFLYEVRMLSLLGSSQDLNTMV